MLNPHEHKLGGFSENDQTIDFYLRVRELLTPDSVVLDIGAGRAGWFDDDPVKTRHQIRHLKPLVSELIAADVDPAVSNNRASTQNIVYDGKSLPLEDQSVDVVIADYVLEHIDDPSAFKAEVSRVLKPGGYLCARTPHKYHYISIAARLVRNASHTKVLAIAQPDRKAEDVFPTCYKLNRMSDVMANFSRWKNHSFLSRADPAYYGGRQWAYHGLWMVQRLMPIWFSGTLFVFLQKR
ncbi:MAG: class I SAM-dependent methyltransferase [Burkholderiaceae bacterium]